MAGRDSLPGNEPTPDAPGAPGDRGTGSEPIVLGGLETAVVSAGVLAYTIDAPARARVLIARVP